nr:guanine nucleotide-binding protein-like NSN1 [Tanacetum cinerariifolium]
MPIIDLMEESVSVQSPSEGVFSSVIQELSLKGFWLQKCISSDKLDACEEITDYLLDESDFEDSYKECRSQRNIIGCAWNLFKLVSYILPSQSIDFIFVDAIDLDELNPSSSTRRKVWR